MQFIYYNIFIKSMKDGFLSKFREKFAETLYDLLNSLYGNNGNFIASIIKKQLLLKSSRLRQRVLSKKIKKLSDNLSRSSILMEEIEAEFQKQREIAEEWKKEADTAKAIASMHQEEIDAVSKVLGVQMEIENRKSSRRALIWNIIFCIVGIIGGYFISKLLP